MAMDLAGGLISNTDVDALEQVALLTVNGRERTNIEFTVGVASLTAFEVAFKPMDSTSSNFFVVANATAKFTTPGAGNVVLGASGDLTGAAAGAHWLILDTAGVAHVRIRAAGANSTIVGSWGSA